VDGYTANIAAWQTALAHAARARLLPSNSAFILHPSDALLSALSSPQYGRPLGLGAVIDESVRAGFMIPVKEFLTTDRSIYSKSWVPSPWTVLQWGLQQIGLAGTGSYEGTSGARKLKASAFVLVEVLEKVAAQVLAAREKRGQNLTDRIVSREEFGQELGALGVAGVSNEDIPILLRYLERDRQALSYNDNVSIAIHPIIAEPID
jgi:charged multivesicular body protein 7